MGWRRVLSVFRLGKRPREPSSDAPRPSRLRSSLHRLLHPRAKRRRRESTRASREMYEPDGSPAVMETSEQSSASRAASQPTSLSPAEIQIPLLALSPRSTSSIGSTDFVVLGQSPATTPETPAHQHGKLAEAVHRALHYEPKRKRKLKKGSLLQKLVGRAPAESPPVSNTTTEEDECESLEAAIMNLPDQGISTQWDDREEWPAPMEFLFFSGCPDDSNLYRLEMNQHRRRPDLAVSREAADRGSASDAAFLRRSLVYDMPPVFAPRLNATVIA